MYLKIKYGTAVSLSYVLYFKVSKKTKDVLVHTHMLCIEEFRTMQRTFQYDEKMTTLV